MTAMPRRLSAPRPAGARALECWCLPTSPAALEAVRPWLTGQDRRRAQRYRNRLRRRSFLIGSGLLRWALGRRLGVAPRRVLLEQPRNRRPRHRSGGWLDAHALSVTHSRQWVLVGILPRAALGWRLGLDAEHAERHPTPGLNARLPWPDPVTGHRLLRRWTLTEAALKADGHGLPALACLALKGGADTKWRLTTDTCEIVSAALPAVRGIPGIVGAVAVGRRRRGQPEAAA